MKKFFPILCVFTLAFLLCSCASKPVVVTPADWKYEREAIRIHLRGDPQLNLYQGSNHTLLLCVYHLRDPNAFHQLLDEKDGIPKLLECGRFDPAVTYVKRLVIQPGQELRESLDRAEGAKYVGIVAGYYLLQKERVTRFFEIPVTEEKKGGTMISRPAVLNIDLYLGPEEIQQVGGK